jgi:acetyltransferase
LLVILAPQGMTNPAQVARALQPYARDHGKPVLASWMGGRMVAEGEAILNHAGIPTFAYPDTAARAFVYMWRYAYNLRGLYETPTLTETLEATEAARSQVEALLNRVRGAGRTLLTEAESKQILALYDIPTVTTRIARNETDAVACAREIGYPVVLKVHSETITHKTDVGGVKLGLSNEEAVRRAYRAIEASVAEKAGRDHFLGVTVQPMMRLDGYELILGSSVDPQFGPVILFGSGGQLVEVYRDRALALPPLNSTLAQRLMEQTKIYTALKGVRGRAAVDLPALERILVRFSQLVIEQSQMKEIDINPLVASPERMLALDARIVLHGAEVTTDQLPKPAIRPYPMQYVAQWTMNNGEQVLLRPIRPEDEPLMVRFHESLSDQSVHLRYFHMEKLSTRIAHERLIRKCFIDYDREMALVADRVAPDTGQHEILGVGRLTRMGGGREAEIAVLVTDRFQRAGLGTELMRRLIQVAREEKLERIVANFLLENATLRTIAERLGFTLEPSDDPECMTAALRL